VTSYAYIRVSTDRQDLDNQRHGVIEYAKANGLEPLTFFDDTVTGKKSWRDRDIGKLLGQAKKGDVLLVSEISRLARSTLQVLEILQHAAEKEIAVHVVKNRMIMDGSLHARITATVLGLAAEIEREFISARTTEALARRKAEGLPLGRPKGRMSDEKKLDKRSDEIKDLLAKGVHKTSIARIVGCSPNTLYLWMEANNMSRYIKSRTRKAADQKAGGKKKAQ
jgi:DNA invertase Pin-like site-specific DNA recombinase